MTDQPARLEVTPADEDCLAQAGEKWVIMKGSKLPDRADEDLVTKADALLGIAAMRHRLAHTVPDAGLREAWKERGWMPAYILDKVFPGRPLAWREPTDHPQDGFGDEEVVAVADGIGGRYSIRAAQLGHEALSRMTDTERAEKGTLVDGKWHWKPLLWWAHDEFIWEACESVDDAKRKAEADWQKRLRALLSTSPVIDTDGGLAERVRGFAALPTISEMPNDMFKHTDFSAEYDAMVRLSRVALGQG